MEKKTKHYARVCLL